MQRIRLYSKYVDVTPDMCADLKACIRTHMSIYNLTLSILEDNPHISYKEIKDIVIKYVRDMSKTNPENKYLLIPLLNEIYYQYKKFANGDKIQKQIFNIQYLAFLTNNYTGKAITLVNDNTIKIRNISGYMTLLSPLPDLGKDNNSIIYINLSYSILKDKFKLAIFCNVPN